MLRIITRSALHGVLAPNAAWRRAIVPAVAGEIVASPEGAGEAAVIPARAADDAPSHRRARPRYRAWADLMRRAFESDVLACPQCGGRLVVLATIDDPAVIQRILRHLGLSLDAGDPVSARGSPEADGRTD